MVNDLPPSGTGFQPVNGDDSRSNTGSFGKTTSKDPGVSSSLFSKSEIPMNDRPILSTQQKLDCGLSRAFAFASKKSHDPKAGSPRKRKRFPFALLALLAFLVAPVFICAADSKPSPEDDYYKIIEIPIPDSVTLECGGMEFLPDGTLAVLHSPRRHLLCREAPSSANLRKIRFVKWATGMHEVMGLAYNKKDGCLYAVQRGEVTRLKDTHSRGKADVYETFCDDWGISGDYHEYPWMSKFDQEGNLWVMLTLTGSFTSEARFRGWCLRVTPEGKVIPTCSGLRSPAGITFNDKGEAFCQENQGPWAGGDNFNYLEPGKFEGHPIGNKWYDLAPNMQPRPQDPQSGSRIWTEAPTIPQYNPPSGLGGCEKVGQSGSGVVFDSSEGKFGPFAGQFFCCDQHHSNLNRYGIEARQWPLSGMVHALSRWVCVRQCTRHSSRQMARSSSAEPAAAGARSAARTMPSNASSGPAKCHSKCTTCTRQRMAST